MRLSLPGKHRLASCQPGIPGVCCQTWHSFLLKQESAWLQRKQSPPVSDVLEGDALLPGQGPPVQVTAAPTTRTLCCLIRMLFSFLPQRWAGHLWQEQRAKSEAIRSCEYHLLKSLHLCTQIRFPFGSGPEEGGSIPVLLITASFRLLCWAGNSKDGNENP